DCDWTRADQWDERTLYRTVTNQPVTPVTPTITFNRQKYTVCGLTCWMENREAWITKITPAKHCSNTAALMNHLKSLTHILELMAITLFSPVHCMT
ncbi:Hypothetical predicted protein, partial [Xyrichtys novacula]